MNFEKKLHSYIRFIIQLIYCFLMHFQNTFDLFYTFESLSIFVYSSIHGSPFTERVTITKIITIENVSNHVILMSKYHIV